MSVFLPRMLAEEQICREIVDKYRVPGLVRVPLDQIGCWPGNRMGGCCPQHVHEVAAGIVSDGTRLSRYDSVDLVKIPAAFLEDFRDCNKAMCDSADYMPLFNADMVYVLLTKTHFTFAHKLFRDGGRTLFNLPAMGEIKLLPCDREGHMIQEQGVLASIFDEDFFREPEAMWSYALQDNIFRH